MSHPFPKPILQSIITFICILIAVPATHGDDDEQYKRCSSPYNYKCGPLSANISYPFWAKNIRPEYCGHQEFELKCLDNQFPTIQGFRVLEIIESHQFMRMAQEDILDNFCSGIFQETNINPTLFSKSENVRDLNLFFDCGTEFNSQQPGKNNFISCPSESGRNRNSFYTVDDYPDLHLGNLSNSCSKVIRIPIPLSENNTRYLSEGNLREVLNQGFEVIYHPENMLCLDCNFSRGICGSNQDSNEFLCLCRDQAHMRTCLPSGPSGNGPNLKLKIGIGLGTGLIVTIIILIIICIFKLIKKSSILWAVCCRKVTQSDKDLEAFIRNYGPLSLKRYNFSEVKKMTNSFKEKLGHGGFGGVYKGKLLDGRLVAVKLLNASKGDGQDFINEVASISRTSHVNIVTLLGFCLEGNKRVLIYEFMPNGSLEKFINNADTSKPSTQQHLGWEKMYEIVVGVAKGLEYLHRGCNTRILHFDIKPHNILLDEDFCPKISDFGMAKLCLMKESIVSMLEARGTIGYIAPEVFSRNFGEVSHKSDVYSYGMMIMELVGCKHNRNAGSDRSSEIYFPHWIYRHIEKGKQFKLPGVITSKESEIVKKMIIVGLWCVQTRPSDRPPMNKVIEMLLGSIEALQIPPMPFDSSPPRSQIDSSTISTP